MAVGPVGCRVDTAEDSTRPQFILAPLLDTYRYIVSVAQMMSLIANRAPSLILFGGIQTVMWTWVWSQQETSRLISGPLHSAIPKGYVGQARFQRHARGTYAYA
ncbi:uncharacterized protein B0H18DRAFT_1113218 [Fomitopsis serialis]|uniref:uncharacterized protein n=1 Tax=Fomitopsis serialis TaxID=139415 RepID=UPI002008220F|nr:uncharacterized protein B0H18DRAFT_1113218 [Neoantrodia serialis]KAH9937373.1 hypothetical protein B0H18DRAFT_1113218 [Neoantrodia serialis]